MGVWCLSTTVVVDAELGDAYTQLKTLLTQKECKILLEDPHKSVTVKQGSLWGTSPKTAKKTIHFRLSPNGSGTEVTRTFVLSPDYVRLTVAGCVFAVALALLCAWISVDLGSFAATQQQSSWSWLVQSGNYVNVQGALLLSDLARVLAFFLAVTLALEGLILFYVKRGLGEFAAQILETLGAEN